MFCTREYERSSFKVKKWNVDGLNEHERLIDHCLFSTIDKSAFSDDPLIIFILNVQWLVKHVNDIVNDYKCLKNDVVGFTKTQMKSLESMSIINDTLKDFNMNFNNSVNKFPF